MYRLQNSMNVTSQTKQSQPIRMRDIEGKALSPPQNVDFLFALYGMLIKIFLVFRPIPNVKNWIWSRYIIIYIFVLVYGSQLINNSSVLTNVSLVKRWVVVIAYWTYDCNERFQGANTIAKRGLWFSPLVHQMKLKRTSSNTTSEFIWWAPRRMTF